MRFESRAFAPLALAACAASAVACTSDDDALPKEDVLRVEGTLPGPNGPQGLSFRDARSRGEWWPCDARFTAQACVDDGDRSYHVNVFIGRPERASPAEGFADLHQAEQARIISTVMHLDDDPTP